MENANAHSFVHSPGFQRCSGCFKHSQWCLSNY